MPISVHKVRGGYKATDPSGKSYSKKPLSKAKAVAQMLAIQISMRKRRKGKK